MQKILEKFRNIDKTAILIFTVAFVIRLAYLAIILQHSPIDKIASSPPDTVRYMNLAKDLADFQISNESNLYMVGFGYSLFLALLFLLSGKALLFTLICQIVVASVTTMLIYKIGCLIVRRRIFGIIASVINAISPTALSLNTAFLSETIFFACIVLSIYTYLKVITDPTIKKYILMGILIAYATFTRSVGQFLPIVFILAVVITPAKHFMVPKKRVILSIIISMSLALILIATWAFRNYLVNDTYVVSGTGPGAAAMYLGTSVLSQKYIHKVS
jgi:hypothetical protein